MRLQLITFRLAGLDPAAYARVCEAAAPEFARLPGLLAKVWLGDEAGAGTGGPYGGLYLWQDRAALEAYRASERYAGLRANPALSDVADRDFSVLEAPTRITAALGGAPAAGGAAG
jgi:hypothetical protein